MSKVAKSRAAALKKGLRLYASARPCSKSHSHQRNGMTTRLTVNRICFSCYRDRHDWNDSAYRAQWAGKMSTYRNHVKAHAPAGAGLNAPYEIFLKLVMKGYTMAPNVKFPERQAARAAGLTKYEAAIPCAKCGTRLRYVANNACMECSRVQSRARANTEAGRAAGLARQNKFRAKQQALIMKLMDEI